MHFEPGDTEKTIVVNETPEHDTEDAYKFQVGETRSYRFLVLDKGGFLLAYRDRDIFTGTSVPSSGIFEEKEVTVFTEEKCDMSYIRLYTHADSIFIYNSKN